MNQYTPLYLLGAGTILVATVAILKQKKANPVARPIVPSVMRESGYTVATGDMSNYVAHRLNVQPAALIAANALPNLAALDAKFKVPGTLIKLPAVFKDLGSEKFASGTVTR